MHPLWGCIGGYVGADVLFLMAGLYPGTSRSWLRWRCTLFHPWYLLTYQRITIGLTRARLDGLELKDIDPEKEGEMDAVDQIENMRRVGEKIATEQVHMELLQKYFV
jgi:hypothetical protein